MVKLGAADSTHCARREVDQTGRDGTRLAALPTSVAICDGGLDGCSVVCNTITLGTIVFDVAEDL